MRDSISSSLRRFTRPQSAEEVLGVLGFVSACLSLCLSVSVWQGRSAVSDKYQVWPGLADFLPGKAWHGLAMADLRCLSAPTTSSTRLSPPSSQVLLILSQTLPGCPPDCILYHSFSPPSFSIPLSVSFFLSLSPVSDVLLIP